VDKNDSSCIIEEMTLKGRHSQNLQTHIRSYHADEYEVLVKSKVQNIQKIKVIENEKRELQDPTTQSKVNKIEFFFLIKYLNSIMFCLNFNSYNISSANRPIVVTLNYEIVREALKYSFCYDAVNLKA